MPDTIFYNGSILTVDDAQPRAEALAVRGERILVVGRRAAVEALARPDTERIDLEGRCLVPGFHDAHLHLTGHGLELSQLKLHDTPTLEEALSQIGARAATLEEGAWLVGAGFSTARWGVTDLLKDDLDRVAPNHPVFLRSQDHHSAWVSSEALRRAGLTASTPDPEDGVIVRGADGEPSGLLLEHAQGFVSRHLPPPSDEDLEGALWAAGRDLAGLGVTTVHHMAAEPPAYWRQLGLTASREDFPLRVWACIDQEHAEHARAVGLATGQGGARFTVGGAKFFADGALGSLTAWMLEPYTGTATCGLPVHGPEVMRARFPLVLEAGLVPVVHAIGDAANRAVLDVLEATCPQWGAKGLRPRLEHAQHLHPDDVARVGALGLVASVQPLHLVFDAKRIRELLADRASRAYTVRSLLQTGARLAFGSDTPVANPDVRLGLKAACTREGADGDPLNPGEALTVAEALAAYTAGAAYAIGREGRSGRLRAGYDADFAVLSHDPTESLEGLRVEGTMLAGRWTKPLA